MGTTHISLAEAARDLPELLDRVRAGEDIVIDDGSPTPIRLAPASPARSGKLVSEVIAALEGREKELGHPLRMGPDFADDLDEIVRNRRPYRGTPISEAIARLDAIEKERGYPAVMDEDYAADMREIIANRKPRDTSAWD